METNKWEEIKKLCPNLYKDYIYFECGKRWFDLILQLSLKIEEFIKENPSENHTFVIQVKEKYGSLRFYLSDYTKETHDLIHEAEAASSQTCEICGKKGKMRGIKMIKCLCDICGKGWD